MSTDPLNAPRLSYVPLPVMAEDFNDAEVLRNAMSIMPSETSPLNPIDIFNLGSNSPKRPPMGYIGVSFPTMEVGGPSKDGSKLNPLGKASVPPKPPFQQPPPAPLGGMMAARRFG